jgi:CheY-like chemotaxis protein
MTKRVLDVGNCGADHVSIRRFIEEHFDAQVARAQGWGDVQAELRQNAVDLILVNRVLDRCGSEGLGIIRRIKADPQFASIPCLLLSNYADYQEQAVRAGAEPGFGKADLRQPETLELLRRLLGGAAS